MHSGSENKGYVTVCSGQARVDGVVCEISTHQEKLTYLQRVKEAGISNIEMECTAIASLCKMTGVKCAVVCVALLDRLKGDQVLELWARARS